MAKKPAKKSGSGGGVIVLLLLLYVHVHYHVPLPGLDLLKSSGSVSGGNKSCHKLEHLWENAGGNPKAAHMAASIAMAESSGRQYAENDTNTNGTIDRGYWQINSVHGSMSTFDPMENAKSAIQLSYNGTNWNAWTTYTSGAYRGLC